MGLILIGSAESNKGKAIALQTRLGTDIPNEQYWEVSPLKLAGLTKALDSIIKNKQNQVQERKAATGLYNCHGMTFACRRTGIFETVDVKTIINDDGYKKIDLSEVLPGDIILYFDDNELAHSGLVVEIRSNVPFVLSKWGSGGEFIHHFKVCEYPIDAIEFYREV